MKRMSLVIAGIAISAICCYQLLTSFKEDVSSSTPIVEKKQSQPKIRESITFILGEDKDEHNRYYDEAARYYIHNLEGKTEFLITNCRSLQEVKDYLNKNIPKSGLPWGLINLVSHGNQWTGLSVRVTPDSKRTTVARLREHMNDTTFQTIPKTIIDSDTEIFIHGCGIGNNRELMQAIAEFFGSNDHLPIVRASKLFEYYASVQCNDKTISQRYLADTWMISYQMGEQPNAIALMSELREKYHTAQVDWNTALSRSKPEQAGDLYHYTFEVPVKWIIPIEHGVISKLNDEKSQLEWIVQQKQITDELANLQIPVEKFKWSLTNAYTDNLDGSRSPAVWVRGYSTMFTVLQALTVAQRDASGLVSPFTPDLNDNRYYTTIIGTLTEISKKDEKRFSER